jgi:hypothetical protein
MTSGAIRSKPSPIAEPPSHNYAWLSLAGPKRIANKRKRSLTLARRAPGHFFQRRRGWASAERNRAVWKATLTSELSTAARATRSHSDVPSQAFSHAISSKCRRRPRAKDCVARRRGWQTRGRCKPVRPLPELCSPNRIQSARASQPRVTGMLRSGGCDRFASRRTNLYELGSGDAL